VKLRRQNGGKCISYKSYENLLLLVVLVSTKQFEIQRSVSLNGAVNIQQQKRSIEKRKHSNYLVAGVFYIVTCYVMTFCEKYNTEYKITIDVPETSIT